MFQNTMLAKYNRVSKKPADRFMCGRSVLRCKGLLQVKDPEHVGWTIFEIVLQTVHFISLHWYGQKILCQKDPLLSKVLQSAYETQILTLLKYCASKNFREASLQVVIPAASATIEESCHTIHNSCYRGCHKQAVSMYGSLMDRA